MRNRRVWLAVAFTVLALMLSAPFLPRWLWIGGTVAVVGVGLVLVIAAVKRRDAKTIEAVGLLPSLPSEPPSDLDVL
jgi:cellobiose-specific phosphotransferase system component IIC